MVAVAATDTAAPHPAGESRRQPSGAVARPATLVAAGLATASVPLHAWMLAAHSHGGVLSLLMGAMALWCLWCVVDAVRSATCIRAGAVRHLGVMAAAMTVLHVALFIGFPGIGAHGHHGATAAGSEARLSSGAGLMLAVVVLELVVCFACAVALRPGCGTKRTAGVPTLST